MQLWVCGFALYLSPEYSRVVLVRKGDELNGVSGYVQGDDRTKTTMCRSWDRQVGRGWGNWTKFGELQHRDKEIHLYKAFIPRDFLLAINTHDNNVVLANPTRITEYNVHETLLWIVPVLMSVDRPRFVTANWNR